MALTGIQIYKLLPKTNCGECGVPTCLAFAMNLAAGKEEAAAPMELTAELELPVPARPKPATAAMIADAPPEAATVIVAGDAAPQPVTARALRGETPTEAKPPQPTDC